MLLPRLTTEETAMPTTRQFSARSGALRTCVSTMLAAAMLVVAAAPAQAQSQNGFIAPVIPAVPIVPSGFDITGFIQEATLDVANAICTPAHPRLAGGTVTVNG